MKRLTLFAKGNVDVHDSLHSCRIGGRLEFNGINDVLRNRQPALTVRLKHETFTRSDALLAATGAIPPSLSARGLTLGSYPEATQFSRATFETPVDAVILSLQPDMATQLHRHRSEGYFFYASEIARWSEENKQWLKSEFELVENLEVAQSMSNFRTMVGKIRERSDVPVLVYNVSPIMPGEIVHCYQGFGETFGTRIRRFNLGLIDLSEELGISIIDVETLVARHGGDALKLDPVHLTPVGYRLVADEVVRVLDDLGVLGGQ